MTPESGLVAFSSLFVFRYVRLIASTVSYFTAKPIPVSAEPAFSPENVTVIIATIGTKHEKLLRCLLNAKANKPHEIFAVTVNDRVLDVVALCQAHDLDEVVVLGIDELNKRKQMLPALRQSDTEITIFLDDDVFWPKDYLKYILAPFDDPDVGAAGTRQRVHREAQPNVWNFLGICYIERRNFNTVATNNIDGGISTLSGRTCAYRTHILKNEAFYHYFLNDTFFGRKLNTDDDKCLTRWVYSRGWKIRLQVDDRAILVTTLENGTKFINQCMRWARAHWRGNLTVMKNNDYWYKTHMWSLYAIYIASFQTPALVIDGLLFYFLRQAIQSLPTSQQVVRMVAFGIWVFFTKIIKLMPHFFRNPSDVRFIPVMVLFSYLHGFINIYAALSLHVTAWGGQDLTVKPFVKPKVNIDAKNIKPFAVTSTGYEKKDTSTVISRRFSSGPDALAMLLNQDKE